VTVYIDNACIPFGRMLMCHMISDSPEELREMADRIGVPKKWIQIVGERDEHMDICLSKKSVALMLGAREVTARELARILIMRDSPETKKIAIYQD